MLSEKVLAELNRQMNREFYSSYLYMGLAVYFRKQNWNGFAHWMDVQAKEEFEHAMKFYHYIFERDGVPEWDAVEKPPSDWDSPLAAFEAALSHEMKITSHINDLVKMAREEGDYATEAFLQWFVTEQVEEEASVREIIHHIKQAPDSPSHLFLLDRHLAQRKD